MPRRTTPRRITTIVDALPRGAGARVAPNRVRLRSMTPRNLKKAAVASALGTSLSHIGPPVDLTPGHPKVDGGYLRLQSPIHVDSGPVGWSGGKVTDGVALFSSKYFALGNPSVQVTFDQLSGGFHLVELRLGMFQSGVKYKFRLLGNPGVPTENVEVSNTGSVYKVVPPNPSYSGPYTVTFLQTNPKSGPMASWYFHGVGIWPTS